MFRYFLFYKPYQVLTQFTSIESKKNLSDFFQNIPKDIYPVGRLDFDSEGLLLLTNDHKFAHHFLEPKFGHLRTYFVQVEGSVNEESICKLQDGVAINVDGKIYQTKKAIVEQLEIEPILPERFPPIRFRKNIPTSWLSVSLREGKNRQVRKMTAAVGHPTLRLVRYAIGEISIANWHSGEIRELDKQQIQLLLKK